MPCDIVQNEVLCTEIISILHRIIFSAFFRSQPGSLLADPENIVKSNIYWQQQVLIYTKEKSKVFRYNTACTNPITIDGEDLEDVKTFSDTTQHAPIQSQLTEKIWKM
ncbi:unnamed protein product [Schistosoma margrebowiei]|uniref:Uncharacterized protein n=1 Tax=Schistosoma margrebowiei TaxID=48269 RepID=A0A3P8EHT6_9TREM|nr:unnamed protein product [Schistosoma margrebowiei]